METKAETQHYLRHEDRREMIAQAARLLLVEKGIAGLRTRDLAARVGISVSTLQFHVRSKDALLVLVAESTRDAFLALLPPAPDPGQDAARQLRAEASAYHASLRDRPELAISFAQLEQASAAHEELAALIAAFKSDWAGRYRQILSIGRDQGVFRADLEPFPAALMVAGALVAFQAHGPRGLAMFWPVYDEIERGLLARDGQAAMPHRHPQE